MCVHAMNRNLVLNSNVDSSLNSLDQLLCSSTAVNRSSKASLLHAAVRKSHVLKRSKVLDACGVRILLYVQWIYALPARARGSGPCSTRKLSRRESGFPPLLHWTCRSRELPPLRVGAVPAARGGGPCYALELNRHCTGANPAVRRWGGLCRALERCLLRAGGPCRLLGLFLLFAQASGGPFLRRK